jgi:hypothetical protein
MWVFTKQGFYSVVQDRYDPAVLLVRARVRGDIERLWPTAKVVEDEGADYAYRARLSRAAVSRTLAQAIKEIDYENYKSSIKDHRRTPWYLMVWDSMLRMQDALGRAG